MELLYKEPSPQKMMIQILKCCMSHEGGWGYEGEVGGDGREIKKKVNILLGYVNYWCNC